MKILKQNIKINAASKETIARADDVFAYVDPDFENYGTDRKSPKTEAIDIALLEQDKDGMFKDIFGSISSDLDSLCLTQAQIIEFVRAHKAEINPSWYTFFLFKVGDEFFVACVRVYSDGPNAHVYRFSYDYVWRAEVRRRVVVPATSISSSLLNDPLAPCTFVPCPNCGAKIELTVRK